MLPNIFWSRTDYISGAYATKMVAISSPVFALSVNSICRYLHLVQIAAAFYFFAPSDSRFSNSCILAKYCPILTNHTSMEIYFEKLPYDRFCGPGSQMRCQI